MSPVRTPFGDAYAELYVAKPADSCRVALTRAGTRVIEAIATLAGLEHPPWSSKYLEGLVDAPFLNLTPGTRSGLIHDERYAALLEALPSLEAHLDGLIEAQQRVVVSPAASTVPGNELRRFRAPSRDRSRRRVEEDMQLTWESPYYVFNTHAEILTSELGRYIYGSATPITGGYKEGTFPMEF